MLHSTETSPVSMERTLLDVMDPSTSFSAVRLAPISAPPTTQVSASTAKSPATISRPSDLHGRPALAGSDLRTHLGSALGELTGCAHYWEMQATPSGLAWWKLKMPALRTREDVPMFSDADATRLKVPTPSAQDYGSNKGGAAGREGPERPSLKRMLTQTATDNLTAPSMQKWAGALELMAMLASAMDKLPTPTASTGGAEPEGDTGRKLITVLRGRLAAPTARDWRSGKASAATFERGSRPLNEQLYALGIRQGTALLGTYLWLMAWPIDYAATAYPSAPSKRSSRAGARRSATPS